jgi:uncharacterized protein (TIGR02453 family)
VGILVPSDPEQEAMAFSGWPVEALTFYEQLEADNTRTFWLANKRVYETAVREPMELLLAELDAEQGYGASKIFRPNRDVRFSADKSPYKTNVAATMDAGPYVSLSADGLSAGRGYYMMAKDQLVAYREAVADESSGPALEAICTAARQAGLEVTARDSLKTAPRGYPKDHPRIELLRHKGLIAWRQWPPTKWLHTKAVKQRIVDFTEQSQPLVDWLDTHVGPSALDDGWG